MRIGQVERPASPDPAAASTAYVAAPDALDRTGWQGREEWRGEVGRRWAEASRSARRQFGWLSDATYPHCGLRPGGRVLDVGCGSGDTSRRLAELVGPTGSVTAADLSTDVLRRAAAGRDEPDIPDTPDTPDTPVTHGERSAPGAPGTPRAVLHWVHTDAGTHPWPTGTFDVVFSRLGTMFFDEPPAAFANLWRACRPGGRLAFTCWPDRTRCPVLLVPLRALAGVVPLPPSAPAGSPNPFSLGDAAATAGLLERAGWSEVAVRELRTTLRLPDRLEDAVALWLRSIPVTLVAPDPDAATRAAMAAALTAVVPADRRIEQRALLVTARA